VSLSDKSKGPVDEGSTIFGLARGRNGSKKEPYHQYRLRLISHVTEVAPELLARFRPDRVAAEIVPVVGGGNFIAATQSELARTAVTVIFVVAAQNDVPVVQIGATSIKARIGGKNKATKVAVRNGVLKLLPETERFREEWKTVFDRSDAYGAALAELGLKV
jgi:Holliday junction resolvasome RuvABC endonuclease subunit